jgi:hypothetical protein
MARLTDAMVCHDKKRIWNIVPGNVWEPNARESSNRGAADGGQLRQVAGAVAEATQRVAAVRSVTY